MSLEAEVRDRALAFANDIAVLVRRSIADEVMRLVGAGPGRRENGGRPATPTKRAAARARSAKVTDKQVLAAIRGKKGGTSAADLSEATGLRSGALSYRLNKLRTAKKVRSTGKTAKTRYFIVG